MNERNVNVLANALAYAMLNPDKVAGAKEFGFGQKVSGTPDAVYAHGPGGIFSSSGIDNVVVNASMVPQGIDSILPVYPTIYTAPLYPTLTGFSEDTGDEPSGVCDDCLGGTMQGCNLTATFGRVCRESDEIEINRVMQQLNRGETTPLTLLGDVLGPGNMTKMPNTPAQWLEVVTRAEMVKVAVLIQRKLSRLNWQGDPANNTANGGYKEYPGLEMLVGTGKVDAETGVACEALDSLVFDFAYNDVGGTIAGNDIVVYISMMEWYVRHIAERTGMMPVNWVFAMRPELWYELSAIWACRYLTDRCNVIDGSNIDATPFINAENAVKIRDDMRNGMFITVNGRKYPVVTDDGITEEHGDPAYDNYSSELTSGQYASDIFFLPTVVRGGMRVLYYEHMDYSKASADIALSKSGNDFWTDGGRFFWTAERLKWCYNMAAKVEPRIILRTPQLAARLDDVRYTPLKHLRSPFYGDPYFEKGGKSERSDPSDSWYNEWTRQ